ncbi:unnamed protein product [Gongylonema pulchrum]|uniref:DNA-directed DNA polymerase n=1 Tax=Gongylonema pulchrum TaxID=637853 RepID=A0A183E3B8_9BILA|nr:unnamed protein product [Gongylonema pulchrum]
MAVIIRQHPKPNEATDAMSQKEEIDEQFFELTVNDVQSIRRDLRAQAYVLFSSNALQSVRLLCFSAENRKHSNDRRQK